MYPKIYLQLLVWMNAKAKSASLRLTKITGKSPVPTHPKHLLPINIQHQWYLPHIFYNDTMLDVGCGDGMHSITSSEFIHSSDAIDYSPELLHKAKVLAKKYNAKNIVFMQGNLEKRNALPQKKYDIVIMLDIIEHLHNRQRVLSEVTKRLKKEGRLLITFPNSQTLWKQRMRRAGLSSFADPDHKIEYTYEEMQQELARAGFTIQSIEPITYDTVFTGLADLIGGVSLGIYQIITNRLHGLGKKFPQQTTGWRVVAIVNSNHEK